ncbi:hypothetical protein AJ87_46650 [Rhizobium yanglingense]|nr:hypothetical protein AJ87_46650 [Rhizobium yanglingense]
MITRLEIRTSRSASIGVVAVVHAYLFPNSAGGRISRSNVTQRLNLAVEVAARTVPGLKNKAISPHTFRHTTAMHLLQSGVDLTVIALWLGHEDPRTTHIYV